MLHGSTFHQIDASGRPKEAGVGTSDSRDRLAGVIYLPYCSTVQLVSPMDIHGPAVQRCCTPFPALYSGVTAAAWMIAESPQVVRWDIIGAIDIATEVALFAMAILLVKDLKMDVSKKSFVVVAFGLRLPCVSIQIRTLPLLLC